MAPGLLAAAGLDPGDRHRERAAGDGRRHHHAARAGRRGREPGVPAGLQLAEPGLVRRWARQLEQQGLPASVLEPRDGEEGFRVVLGPYPTREVAESTGRRLGRPFFIYQPDR